MDINKVKEIMKKNSGMSEKRIEEWIVECGGDKVIEEWVESEDGKEFIESFR